MALLEHDAARASQHVWRRFLASLRRRPWPPALVVETPAEAMLVFLVLVVLLQSYWVFVLTNYVGILDSAGRTTIVVATPEPEPR